MTRQPHARRVYLPPEQPERIHWRDLVGLVAVVVIAIVLVVLLPLLASPEAPW